MADWRCLVLVLAVCVQYLEAIEQVENPSIARPRKVNAEVENANTIKLRWQAPRIAQENCPVKRYLIRLRHDGGKRSKTWKIDGARYSLSLHDLQEDTLYYIRLMAVTCEGKGARTRWIKVKTGSYERAPDNSWEIDNENTVESSAPSKPTYVRTRTYSDSVILSWQPPESDVIIRGYKVGYGEGVPDLHWRYVDASKRNVTVTQLKPATQYVISLCAYNNAGEGKPEYDLIYTREINNPTLSPFSPPENVRARILSESSVWLQWGDPSLGRHQQVTDERYYNVHYQALPNGKTLSMIVKALYVVLQDLTPGTMYAFKVRTVKDSHSSPFSEVTRNKTFETKPQSPPRSLTVVSTNDSSTVHLAWRPPRQPNGEITAYLVLYCTDQKQPVSTWDVLSIPGNNKDVVMSTLKPNTTYYFKVQARNSQGYGPTSNTLVYNTSPRYNKDSTDNQLTSDEISYDSTDEYNGLEEDTDYYDTEQRMDDEYASPDYDNSPPPAVVGDSSKIVRTGGVSQMSTQAFNSHNGHQYLEDNQLQPLDVSFQSVVKHTVSAVVTWKVPCYDTPKSPVKYMVRYYPADTPEVYTDKSTPTNFVLLDNLRPNHLYKYQVRRMTKDADDSDWSKPGILDTNYPSGES